MNKGDAFTIQERETFGLTGLLSPAVSTLDEQTKRAYQQYHQQPDDPRKNMYLNMLQDSNEVLFYKLLSEHMYEMLPVIYDPTVAIAIEHYSLEYRRSRGVYLSIDHPERIEVSLRNVGAGPDDIDLLVANDAEEILGIGDWGVGGIQISVAIADRVDPKQPGASLLPHVDNLRTVSATVAVEVAKTAASEHLARAELTNVIQRVQDAMWQPVYPQLQIRQEAGV